MPAPLNVDHEQVRMLVLSVGVREAARRCGIKEGTVQDWSAKGKWLAATRPTPALMPPPASMVGPTSPTKPADALGNVLKELEGRTKLNLARATAKAAKHAATLEPGEALAQSKAIKETAGTGAILHGWAQQGDGSGSILINIALQGRSLEELPVIDVAT